MNTTRAAHTPGPWQVGGDRENQKLRNSPATAVFAPDSIQLIATTGGFSDNRRDGEELANEQVANARLIASAPELLDALQRIAAQWDQTKYYGPLNNLARAAIAKATGEVSP